MISQLSFGVSKMPKMRQYAEMNRKKKLFSLDISLICTIFALAMAP